MKTVTVFSGLILLNSAAHACLEHNHDSNHHNASGWQADINLSYREESGPNMKGFLPSNAHNQKAGTSLDHADLSYQTELPTKFSDQAISDQQIGRVALGYHSNDVELSEIWLENRWLEGNLRLTTGKYLPRIGFLNHQHQHAQILIQSPLINKVYWGDQMSEAGLNLQWLMSLGNTQLRQSFNVLGGDHLNSKDNTIANLYQLELQRTAGPLDLMALVNGYYTNVSDRGMFLFDLSNNTHVHSNSSFTEFFDGDIHHVGVGLKLSYQTSMGSVAYQGEYAQRREKGHLYNATTQLADLTLDSYGQYHQLWWSSVQKNWQLGVRFDHLYSDVEVSNTSDNSLDDSRLNNDGATPKRLSWMATWLFSAHQKMQMIYSAGEGWEEYPSQLEVHLQQSFRF